MKSKLKTLPQLVNLRKKLKTAGKKVVLTYGIFDKIHSGTLQYLKKVKSYGDIIFLLVSSDKAVNTKLSQKQRLETINKLDFIDHVSLFDSMIPDKEVNQIKPDVYCDFIDRGQNSKEASIIKSYGGKIKIVPIFPDPFFKKQTIFSDKTRMPAIFLDRDGTINKNKEGTYVTTPNEFEFLPGVLDALKKIYQSKKYKIVVITNQSGIERKLFTHNDLNKIHDHMMEKLDGSGVNIDGIYYCPHHPKNICSCRKPETGMVIKAASEHNINLEKSWFVGDKHIDVLTGYLTGTKTVKLGSKVKGTKPNFYAKNLNDAVEKILKT